MKIFISTVLLFFFTSSIYAEDSNLGYQGEGKRAGYESPLETLERLKNDPNSKIRKNRGWTVINDEKNRTIWSFPPDNHPAYPSAVKREVVSKDGKIYLETSVSCKGKKKVCDKLVQDFIELNNKVMKSVNE